MQFLLGMKASQIKVSFLALFVLCLAWIGWSFHTQVQMQWAFPPIKYRKVEKSPKKIAEEMEKAAPARTDKIVKRRSPDEYRVLYELNITGREKPRAVIDEAPKAAPSKSVESILKLGYIQIDSDEPKRSRGFVLYVDSLITQPVKEAFLHVGDHLPAPFGKIFVAEIHPRKLVFGYEGEEKREEVGLTEIDFLMGSFLSVGPGRVVSASGQLYPPNYSPPSQTSEVRPGEFWISYEDAERFETNYQGALRDVQSSDYYDPKTRKPAGVRVDGLGNQSIATQYGVQQGDIVKSINGYPVTSKAQAIDWVKKNPDLPSYTVEIERQGKLITKTYVPPPKKK